MIIRVEVLTRDSTVQSAELKASNVNDDIASMFCMIVKLRLDTDGARRTVHRLRLYEGESLPYLVKLFNDIME